MSAIWQLMKLTRYWFEFADSAESPFPRTFEVTAVNYDDALVILKSTVSDFQPLQLPKIICDMDRQTLYPNHIRAVSGLVHTM